MHDDPTALDELHDRPAHAIVVVIGPELMGDQVLARNDMNLGHDAKPPPLDKEEGPGTEVPKPSSCAFAPFARPARKVQSFGGRVRGPFPASVSIRHGPDSPNPVDPRYGVSASETLPLDTDTTIGDVMTRSRTSNRWAAAERRARSQLDANRRRIEGLPRGVPAGGISSASSADHGRGYAVISAEYRGRCLECRDTIKQGQQVRYWFDQGVTCQSCTLGGP